MTPPAIPHDAFVFLDYIGIAVFAISGALAAAERRLDFVTFVFFAVVTGVGGGTLRDLLIGAPVFWVNTNATLLICIGAAVCTWFLSRRATAERAILWFDAAGMAAYAIYGASKSLDYGIAPVPAFVMGVLTACAGGIIRDVISSEKTILLRRELYITPAALASGLFILLTVAGLPGFVAAPIAAIAGFVLRALAIVRGLSLPTYSR